jgi:hypothetical protein
MSSGGRRLGSRTRTDQLDEYDEPIGRVGQAPRPAAGRGRGRAPAAPVPPTQVSVPQPVPGILAARALASAAAAAADPVQQNDVQQQDEPLRAPEIVVYSRRAAKKLRSSLDDDVATFGIYDKSTVFTEHDHDSA